MQGVERQQGVLQPVGLELGQALGADADIVRMRYGIQRDGNAPFDPAGSVNLSVASGQ